MVEDEERDETHRKAQSPVPGDAAQVNGHISTSFLCFPATFSLQHHCWDSAPRASAFSLREQQLHPCVQPALPEKTSFKDLPAVPENDTPKQKGGSQSSLFILQAHTKEGCYPRPVPGVKHHWWVWTPSVLPPHTAPAKGKYLQDAILQIFEMSSVNFFRLRKVKHSNVRKGILSLGASLEKKCLPCKQSLGLSG